jgi:hypothetical protein
MRISAPPVYPLKSSRLRCKTWRLWALGNGSLVALWPTWSLAPVIVVCAPCMQTSVGAVLLRQTMRLLISITMEGGEMILSASSKISNPPFSLLHVCKWLSECRVSPKALSQSSENHFADPHRPWTVGRSRRPVNRDTNRHKTRGDFCVPNVHGWSGADSNRCRSNWRSDDICQTKTSTKEQNP